MKPCIDGRPGESVDWRDRGLHYGDGVFETMRVRRRGVRLLDYHMDRLAEACGRLRFAPPDISRLRKELARMAAKRPEGVLKLIVTRGIGTRGYRPSGREKPSRILALHPLPRSVQVDPARLRMCAMRLGCNEALAGLKTLNRLESVLARAEWTDPAVWEGLMRDGDDNIVCGTMSNFFLRRGSSLITPLLDRCGVAGVMRRWVLGRAAELRLRVRQDRVRWSDVAAADEAFMTNAIVGVVPVAAIQHGRARARFAEFEASREFKRLLEAL